MFKIKILGILGILIMSVLLVSTISFISAEEPEIDPPEGIGEGTGTMIFGHIEWYDYVMFAVGLGGSWGSYINMVLHQEGSADILFYDSSVWMPPQISANQKCDICNDRDIYPYGCSEYECKALGKYCSWINNGDFPAACVTDQGDNMDPQITPDPEVLEEMGSDYLYDPLAGEVLFPGENGVKVAYLGEGGGTNGCIPPYTNLTLGINTSENAQCKWSYPARLDTYEEMTNYMYPVTLNPNFYPKNHELFLPSYVFISLEAQQYLGYIGQGTEPYYYYMRCEDPNGNSNNANFVMSFCVQAEPDMTQPLIEFWPNNPYYVQYGQTDAYFEVRTNKPANCSWDFSPKPFDQMQFSMDNCSQYDGDFLNPDENFAYGCTSTVTGISSGEENLYYVRCKDKPWWSSPEDGVQITSDTKILRIVGSYPLAIDEVTVNGLGEGALIKDSTEPIQVELKTETSVGVSEEGYAVCEWSLDNENSYYAFFETSILTPGNENWVSSHTQPSITVYEGEHTLFVRCEDQAGNVAKDNVTFTMEVDDTPPEVVRVYYEDGDLKIITNEEAQCFYSLFEGCGYNMDEGTEMYSSDGLNHFVDWTTESDVFIKCKDKYGNIPVPAGNTHQCTTIVRGSDNYS
jgi:hypothetical protein